MTGFRKLITGTVAVAFFGLILAGCAEPADDNTNTAADTTASMNAGNAGNEELARQFVDEAFNKGNLAFVEQHTATDFVEHTPSPGQEPGLEGFKKFVTQWREAIPDLKTTVHEVVSEGDLVAIHINQTGTIQAPLFGPDAIGKQINVSGIDLVRIKDGKMVEHWGYYEEAKMFQQVGLMPPMDAPPAGGVAAGDGAMKDTTAKQ